MSSLKSSSAKTFHTENAGCKIHTSWGLSVKIPNNLNKLFLIYSGPTGLCPFWSTLLYFLYIAPRISSSFGSIPGMPHLECCIALPANFLYSPEQTQIISHSIWISAWCRERSPLLQDLVSMERGMSVISCFVKKSESEGRNAFWIVIMEQLFFPIHISDLFPPYCLFLPFDHPHIIFHIHCLATR